MPDDAAYFCAQFRRVNPLPKGEVVNVLDGVSGPRPVRRAALLLGRQQLRLVGRGRAEVLHRRRRRVPDDLRHRHRGLLLRLVQLRPRRPVQRIRHALRRACRRCCDPTARTESQQRFWLYRWHITDPIRFTHRPAVDDAGARLAARMEVLPAPRRHRDHRVLVPDAADRTVRGLSLRPRSRDHLAMKIWANSGDSHIIEPPNLFDRLPDHIQERMPRSVKDPSGEFETIYVDGLEFRRDMPKPDPTKPKKAFGGINARPIGTTDERVHQPRHQRQRRRAPHQGPRRRRRVGRSHLSRSRHLAVQHPHAGSRRGSARAS